MDKLQIQPIGSKLPDKNSFIKFDFNSDDSGTPYSQIVENSSASHSEEDKEIYDSDSNSSDYYSEEEKVEITINEQGITKLPTVSESDQNEARETSTDHRQHRRREGHIQFTGVRTFHHVNTFIQHWKELYTKAKYRYFIVKEMKDTEITYIEQLTRMNGIK